MDKFEKLFKQAVEGHEMPFDPQAWENIANELPDSFDQSIKESTGNYEAPYNPAAWDAVSSQLGPSYASWKWIGGSAAALVIIAGASYLASNSDSDQEIVNNDQTVVVHQDDIANNMIVHEGEINDNIDSDENVFVFNDDNSNIDNSENIIHPIDPDLVDVNVNDVNGNDGQIDNQNDGHQNGHVEDGNGNGTGDGNNGQGSHDVTDSQDNADQTLELEKVNPSFTASNLEICEGAKCKFTPDVVNPKLDYMWNFGDGSMSNAINASHKYSKAGEYTVTLEIFNKRNKLVGTSNEAITVNELPETDFTFSRVNEGIPTVTFENADFNSEVVLWNVKGIKQSKNEEFAHTFRKKGNYVVALTAKNDLGCMKTIEKQVKIDNDYNLLAPTAFSPDGDGQSDNFIPAALTVMDVDFTMTIMDKSGKLVYTTQNAFEPWDGRYTEDNTLAPSGASYIWRVVLINKLGEREFYEGQVFVVY